MIRQPAAAGSFYPADPEVLASTTDRLLACARPGTGPDPRGLIVPHAAFRYSGPVAASAFALVRGRPRIRRVAAFGPSHFVPLRGSAVPTAGEWQTPLGPVRIDPELRDLATDAGAVLDDRPHALEHALEVQLPFLLRALGPGFAFLPVAVGVQEVARAADLIERLWDHADLAVVSTDLSHYLDVEAAKSRDTATVEAVLGCAPAAIAEDAACGVFALRGLVELARRRSLEVRLLTMATSADEGGPPDRVVGYGSFAFA